jgi:hypothetical protein
LIYENASQPPLSTQSEIPEGMSLGKKVVIGGCVLLTAGLIYKLVK